MLCSGTLSRINATSYTFRTIKGKAMCPLEPNSGLTFRRFAACPFNVVPLRSPYKVSLTSIFKVK